MCFTNDIEQLNKFRALKKPVTVYKTGDTDWRTGIVTTDHKTVWKVGTIVKPHRIRKPLTKGQTAGSGLYFYTKKCRAEGESLVTCTVNPKDIIAVDSGYRGRFTICTIAAKVITAPNPNQQAMRLKFLQATRKRAIHKIALQNDQITLLEGNRRTCQEYLQQINEELQTLKPHTNNKKCGNKKSPRYIPYGEK